jgi:hypothetical protein
MPVAEELLSRDKARLGPLIAPPRPAKTTPASATDDDDKAQFLDVRKLRTQYMDYLTSKTDEIEEQKNSRHYYHGSQWTPKQIEILRRRHQPPLTWNRINRKINGIVGLVERLRSDPKALPTSVRSQAGADIATQVIRSVLNANDWKGIDPWCLLQCGIEGIAGVQRTLAPGDKGELDLELKWVIGDEYFYDPTTYRLDFKDKGYEGLSKWLHIGRAIELFPDKEDVLRSVIQGDADLTTNADREYKWVITSQQRLRLVEHWYWHNGKWCWAFYVSSVLLDEGISPFFDEKGKTTSSFNMFSSGVDHDGDRYGFVRNLLGPQDSLNQSKSKALHLANSRRLIGEKGAVDDVEKTRIEWARPDGYVEVNPAKTLTPDDKTADLAAFTGMAEAAGNEIDSFAGTNIAVLQGASLANISGRALELLRQPGMAELGPFVLAYRQWKLQLYRDIWTTAQRQWTKERWLPIIADNDPSKVQFIQLNGVGLDQFGRPVLVNALGALDVDIVLDEGPDVETVMQDAYDTLKGYPPGTFPPQVLVELSPMPRERKNMILQMMAPKPAAPMDPLKAAAAKLALEGEAVKNAKTAAEARRADAMAGKAVAESHVAGAKVHLDAAGLQHQVNAHETQTQLDATELSHKIWSEALQLFQQPTQGQSGAAPSQRNAQ